jgi:hypothetical protein
MDRRSGGVAHDATVHQGTGVGGILEVGSGLVHMGAVIAVAAVVRGLGGYR